MIIDREFLHKDITVNCNGQEIDRDYIIDHVDRIKQYLIDNYDVRPGQKAILATNTWPSYLCWFLAAAELGIGFVVSDYPHVRDSRSVQHKLSLYGEIDFVIARENNLYHLAVDTDLAPNIINLDALGDLPPAVGPMPTWAQPDHVLIYSTSSGTTGTPKVSGHTHRFFRDLSIRNADIMGFREEDICLHTKGLHHGSVMGVFMLPSLHKCRRHFQVFFEDHDRFVEVVQKEKINRCICFYEMIEPVAEKLELSHKAHDDLTVYVLSQIKKKTVQKIVSDMGYRIVSIFGCTETSGPLFLPEVNPSNVSNYDLTLFPGPLDDFYHMWLDEHSFLHVEMPDGKVVRTGDKFKITDAGWSFLGRDDVLRKRGRTLYLGFLIKNIENVFNLVHGIDFDLVFDAERSSFYMRLGSPAYSLEEINKRLYEEIYDDDYVIDCVIVGPREDFFTGIKFDQNEVRLRCRAVLDQN